MLIEVNYAEKQDKFRRFENISRVMNDLCFWDEIFVQKGRSLHEYTRQYEIVNLELVFLIL